MRKVTCSKQRRDTNKVACKGTIQTYLECTVEVVHNPRTYLELYDRRSRHVYARLLQVLTTQNDNATWININEIK